MSKKLITPILFFSAVLIIVISLIPRFQETIGLRNQEAAKKEELRRQQEYINNIIDIGKKIDEKADGFNKIGTALPNDYDLLSVLDFVAKTGSQNGMIIKTIGSFATEKIADSNGLKETRFSIEVVGSYSSFKNFVLALENSSRIIDIEKAVVVEEKSSEKEKTGADSIIFSLKMKITSY